jgi:hypothetical protein
MKLRIRGLSPGLKQLAQELAKARYLFPTPRLWFS